MLTLLPHWSKKAQIIELLTHQQISMINKFRGVGVALVTPFMANGAVDYPALQRIIDYVIKNQVDYVVSLGTTGEAAVLNHTERHEVLDFTITAVAGRVPIVAGFGGNSTRQVIAEIQQYHQNGIDAILTASPYYNRPSQEGIFQHYMAIADASQLPIILYNVPSRTASHIKSETTIRLMRSHKNIIGIKEASNDITRLTRILKSRRDDFVVLSGDDMYTLPILACGGAGVISVVANALPREFCAMVNFALSNDYRKAQFWHYQLSELIVSLFSEGNPAGIKAALQVLNLCEDHLRLPLVNISPELYTKIETEVQKFRNSSSKYISQL
ncbi:MAG TPA: 4-hydroxy-tetrahydrodipicolinate synthase [Chitinophagales bacterium]|nr:4-hydroxy-tetrahydrodipicolinate synthase [Chitinophagales bacterium]